MAGAELSFVMRGLDPRIPLETRCHPKRDGRDFRRKDGAWRLMPGHDTKELPRTFRRRHELRPDRVLDTVGKNLVDLRHRCAIELPAVDLVDRIELIRPACAPQRKAR